MKHPIKRRDLLKSAVVSAGGLALGGCATVPKKEPVAPVRLPGDKLNIAILGARGRGKQNAEGVAHENIYALCDVNGELLVDVASAPVRTENTSGSLFVDTGSGSVDVIDAEGDVSVDTGSGSVEVTGSRGDILHVDTGSGSVDVTEVNVRDLNIDTGSGRITVTRATMSSGLLDTGSGSVRIELLSDVDDLTVDTGSGSVTVEFPPELGARLDLESSSGSIDFSVPITVTEFNRSSLRGEIGDGRGMIRIDTGSGSIRFIQR